MPELSPLGEAGLHFGQAFCVPPERRGLPLEQLTPEEQRCVQTVGMGWERRVEAALGLGGSPPLVVHQELRGVTQRPIGSLTYADGVVTLCLTGPRQDTEAAPAERCLVVGHGVDALVATQKILDLLGITATEVGGGGE